MSSNGATDAALVLSPLGRAICGTFLACMALLAVFVVALAVAA